MRLLFEECVVIERPTFGVILMVRRRKSWKTNALFLIALWLILLIASLTVLSSAVTPFLKSLQTQSLISLDWSGYAVSSNLLAQQPIVTGVNGSWTVPRVAYSATDVFSAAWVGVGGQSDTTLIQVGTEHDFVNGQEQYSVWYEMLPANSITIPEVTVVPGDKISASISLVDSNMNNWQIEITNLSNGQGFKQIFSYNSSRLTAEWVVERPTVNNQLAALANFGTVTFTNATAQISATEGTVKSFSNYEILMNDRQNNQLVTVSSLSPDGSSFTVAYG